MRKSSLVNEYKFRKVISQHVAIVILLISNSLNLVFAQSKIGSIGVVEIEGLEFPQEYFESYANQYFFNERLVCPPVSDALIRDQLINSVLRSLEVENTNSASEETKAALKKLTDNFESDSNPAPEVRVEFEIKSIVTTASELKPRLSRKIATSLIVDHYQELVAQRFPLLVDVVLIKRRELELWNNREVDTATKMVLAGNNITEIATAIDRPEHNLYQADEWYALNSLGYKLGEPSDLQPGALIGPIDGKYDPVVVYLEDKKTVSRLRPNVRVNSKWEYALSVAEEDLWNQMKIGMKDKKLKELWSKYTVLLDGKPLQRPGRYPDCPL